MYGDFQTLEAFDHNVSVRQTGQLTSENLVSDATRKHERGVDHVALYGLWRSIAKRRIERPSWAQYPELTDTRAIY